MWPTYSPARRRQECLVFKIIDLLCSLPLYNLRQHVGLPLLVSVIICLLWPLYNLQPIGSRRKEGLVSRSLANYNLGRSRSEAWPHIEVMLTECLSKIFMWTIIHLLKVIIVNVRFMKSNTLIKKKIKFSSYKRKFRWDRLDGHIWLTAPSYIALHLIPTELPYIWEKFRFLFLSV